MREPAARVFICATGRLHHAVERQIAEHNNASHIISFMFVAKHHVANCYLRVFCASVASVVSYFCT